MNHLDPGQWPVILSLGSEDSERRSALDHAAGCPECDRERVRGERLLLALARVPAPMPPRAEVLQRAAAAVRQAMASEVEGRQQATWGQSLAVLGGFATVVGLTAAREGSPWTAALILLGASAFLPWLVARFGGWGLAAAGLSLPFAIWRSTDPSLEVQMGLRCASMEALAAVLPLAVLALVARSRDLSFGPWTFAGAAASGALAGQAALLLSCPSRELGHLLFIHGGTVMLAAAVGAGASRLLPVPATAS